MAAIRALPTDHGEGVAKQGRARQADLYLNPLAGNTAPCPLAGRIMSLFFTLLNRKVIRQQYCAVLFSAVICSRGYLSSDPAHRLSQAPPRLGFVCAGATRQRVLLASPVTAGNKLLVHHLLQLVMEVSINDRARRQLSRLSIPFSISPYSPCSLCVALFYSWNWF